MRHIARGSLPVTRWAYRLRLRLRHRLWLFIIIDSTSIVSMQSILATSSFCRTIGPTTTYIFLHFQYVSANGDRRLFWMAHALNVSVTEWLRVSNELSRRKGETSMRTTRITITNASAQYGPMAAGRSTSNAKRNTIKSRNCALPARNEIQNHQNNNYMWIKATKILPNETHKQCENDNNKVLDGCLALQIARFTSRAAIRLLLFCCHCSA